MQITFDPDKRAKTLALRDLDFAAAIDVFAAPHLTLLDDRFDYGEERFQTYGTINRRLVMVVWTPRGPNRHIISMRKCNEREKKKFGGKIGEN